MSKIYLHSLNESRAAYVSDVKKLQQELRKVLHSILKEDQANLLDTGRLISIRTKLQNILDDDLRARVR